MILLYHYKPVRPDLMEFVMPSFIERVYASVYAIYGIHEVKHINCKINKNQHIIRPFHIIHLSHRLNEENVCFDSNRIKLNIRRKTA